jgi:hypothetical protein
MRASKIAPISHFAHLAIGTFLLGEKKLPRRCLFIRLKEAGGIREVLSRSQKEGKGIAIGEGKSFLFGNMHGLHKIEKMAVIYRFLRIQGIVKV